MKDVLIIGIGDAFHGDEGLACYVLEALSAEPWTGSVDLSYVGHEPRMVMGLISAADLVITVGTLNLGGPAGRLYSWTYPVFQRNIFWMVNEQEQVALLAEALAKVEMAGELPEELLFLWAQPQITHGYGMSSPLRKTVWKTIRVIKRKLFESGLLPEESLSVFPLVRIEPVNGRLSRLFSKG